MILKELLAEVDRLRDARPIHATGSKAGKADGATPLEAADIKAADAADTKALAAAGVKSADAADAKALDAAGVKSAESDGNQGFGCSKYAFISSALTLEGIPFTAAQVQAVLEGCPLKEEPPASPGRGPGFARPGTSSVCSSGSPDRDSVSGARGGLPPTQFSPAASAAWIAGISSAWDFMLVQEHRGDFSNIEDVLRGLHTQVTHGAFPDFAGSYRAPGMAPRSISHPVPDGSELPRLMSHFADQLRSSQWALHPVELAVFAHKRLMDLQPFLYGSGAVALLLLNYLLQGCGYPCVCIAPGQQKRYWDALDTARRLCDLDPLLGLFGENILQAESLQQR